MEAKHYTLVTHNLRFHADDIFACAIVSLVIKKAGGTYTVIRTRDEKQIEAADIVFDVGGIYDPEKLRFDHHQRGGAGMRPSGGMYASCGLVWKTYGIELAGDAELAEKIDKKLFEPIDIEDNGIETYSLLGETSPYTIQNLFYSFRTTWKEDESLLDTRFLELVALAEKVLEREIIKARDTREGQSIALEAYEKAPDKRVIILETNVPAEDLYQTFPEPLYIVRPNTDGGWRMIGVGIKPHSFERRKPMPQAWGGLRDEELAKVTGVSDAVFCHNGLWLAVAKSKEGIMALAKLALEA